MKTNYILCCLLKVLEINKWATETILFFKGYRTLLWTPWEFKEKKKRLAKECFIFPTDGLFFQPCTSGPRKKNYIQLFCIICYIMWLWIEFKMLIWLLIILKLTKNINTAKALNW